MDFSTDLENIITSALILAETCHNKLVMPEHLLLASLGDKVINNILESAVLDLPIEEVKDRLRDYLDRQEHYDEEDAISYSLMAQFYGLCTYFDNINIIII